MIPICSVYTATSLDGFIARKDGNLDWLDEANSLVPDGEDCGFSSFLNSVDALVMGRKTFEKILSFEQWAYGDTPLIVLSRGKAPSSLPKMVTYSSQSPLELCESLSKKGMMRLYVDGGETIQNFLKAGLVKDLTITSIPILIGDGIRLFGSIGEDIKLRHIETNVYKFGFVQSKYEVI